MKNLTVLIALLIAFGWSSVSFGFTEHGKQSVEASLTFTAGDDWVLGVYADATTSTPASEINKEGWSGQLDAAGTRKIRVGTNYLEIAVSGTWEVVTYMDNIKDYTKPANWGSLSDADKLKWIDPRTGLKVAKDVDNDGTPDSILPMKVRSEGIHGGEDLDPSNVPYAIGSVITDNDYSHDELAVFSYIPDKALEDELTVDQPLTKVAKLGTTDLSKTGRVQVRYGIYEALAGDETYTGTIYYELRGN